jgi:hypothetical protein
MEKPLCEMCEAAGRTERATIVDHCTPHRGNWELFLYGRLQSLCGPCHSGRKQQIECTGVDHGDRGGDYSCAVDVHGWPLDRERHPTWVEARKRAEKERERAEKAKSRLQNPEIEPFGPRQDGD